MGQLTDLHIRGLITNQEFATKHGELVAQELRLKQQSEKVERNGAGWLELFENVVSFANHAEKRFVIGNTGEKREILMAVGSNLSLMDRNLRIDVRKPILLMAQVGRNFRWQGLVNVIRTSISSISTGDINTLPPFLPVGIRLGY